MAPRVEQIAHNLQRHWVALTGIAVAALIGGGLGKALTPHGLYQEPQAAQLIANPVEPQADLTPVAYVRHMPDYVMGTDAARPRQPDAAYAQAAYTPSPYEIVETPSVYAHAAETTAADAFAEADRQEAANVGEAASSDSTEVFPAMAPG